MQWPNNSRRKCIVDETKKGTATRDVGLILSAQKVEHYEIATYGSSLEEEKETDARLAEIAESDVNYAAVEEQE